ncbi:MAG: hypothetical protein AB1Z65_08155, partial [Candidatus Sulfomarinibacteraceae bacterium]
MTQLSTIAPIVLGVLCLAAFGVIAIVSAREGERRAVRAFAAIAFCAAVPLVAVPFLPPPVAVIPAAIGIALAATALIRCLVPLYRPREAGGRPTHRVDERDIMFARGRLRPDTPEFDTYYRLHPDNWMHNLVRRAIRVSPGTRNLMLWADDLVY